MNATATVGRGTHENTVMHGDLRVPVRMTVLTNLPRSRRSGCPPPPSIEDSPGFVGTRGGT
jgi:hypothetical protein